MNGEQTEEIETLRAIYGDTVSVSHRAEATTVHAVVVPEALSVIIICMLFFVWARVYLSDSMRCPECLIVSSYDQPHLQLRFTLNPLYPSSAPPSIEVLSRSLLTPLQRATLASHLTALVRNDTVLNDSCVSCVLVVRRVCCMRSHRLFCLL